MIYRRHTGNAKLCGLFLFLTLLALSCFASAQSLEISSEDQQVWLIWPDGRCEQLTSGPQNAGAPAWSVDHQLIAFFRYCPAPVQCTPRIVVIDQGGNVLKEFSLNATSDWEGCNSVTNIDFLDSKRIGFDCHINPSLGEYTTMDFGTGQMLQHWLGFAFTWSPDKSHLAYHGWIPHFSPPYGHSSYLQIDGRTVYPPDAIAGASISEGQHGAKLEMHSIEESSGLYRNIHEFSQFFWAPDNRKVALIDRIYDWKEVKNQPENIGERNVRRFIVIAGLDAESTTLPMLKRCNAQSKIEWRSDNELDLLCGAESARYVINKAGILEKSP